MQLLPASQARSLLTLKPAVTQALAAALPETHKAASLIAAYEYYKNGVTPRRMGYNR